MLRHALIWFALWACAISAAAQTPTATLSGIVSDVSGAAAPGVTVSVHNQSTGVFASAVTDARGSFVVPYLEPGRYRVEAELSGFKRYVQSDVLLEIGRVLSLNIRLEIGAIEETVTVVRETTLLKTETSSISEVIENTAVTNLPLASRRLAGLSQLTGMVTFNDENENDAGIVNFALAGGRSRQQQWVWDGSNHQGVTLFTGVIQLSPPVEAIQEMKIESNSYPAEYGRSIGGVISMTTKSGTNKYQGVLYGFHRNDKLDSKNYFAATKPPREYTTFGGTFGGPIVRNQSFFFFSYEGARRQDGVTRIFNVPTEAELRGDFSGRTGTLIDPVTRQPFPNNIIPASRIDPIGAALAALYPAPNVPGAVSGGNNFRLNTTNDVSADTYIARVDHNFRAADRISVRFTGYDNPVRSGRVYALPEGDPSAVDMNQRQLHFAGTWIHTFSPTLLSESRALYSKRENDNPLPYPTTIVGDIGLQGIDQTVMPRINITGYSSIGPGTQYRFVKPQLTYNVGQVMSWFSGPHSVKFGGEWRRSAVDDNAASTTFSFNDVATGRGFAVAALLLGWSNAVSSSAGQTQLVSDYFAAFVQDDWRINEALTLNVGLRWELDTPRLERNNQQSGFDPIPINPVSGTPGIVTFAGLDGVSRYAHDFDTNNFGPRFGFAWQPFNLKKTVIRGGYGLITGSLYDASLTRTNLVGFGDVRSFTSPDNGLTPAVRLSDGVPPGPGTTLWPGLGAVPVGQAPITQPDFFAQDHENTYAHQFNVTWQQQLTDTLSLEAAYVGNLGRNIGAPAVNINEIPPELRGAVADQRLRPFPQYGDVLWRAANIGRSSYHGLNIKAERRFSAGFNLLANYTYAKFMDDVEANSEAGGAPGSGLQSIYARELDWARSGNDVRHRLVASSVVEVPVGRGRRWNVKPIADALIGGWNVGVIAEYRSGLPYGVIESSNRLNAFSASQRPNLVGDPELSSDRPLEERIARWFNTDAFVFPGNGVIGTAPRNVADGPGLIKWDLSLSKNVPVSAERYFQIRAEVYNLFNRVNLGLPGGSRGTATFGTISSTSTNAREVQLGLRFVF
jgi:outer membrane receptor protein involved in Fe transport